MKRKNFQICLGKGFKLTFDNGYTVSIQWGYNNYCENQTLEKFDNGKEHSMSSNNCEIGIFDNKRNWVTKKFYKKLGIRDLGDDVAGYVNQKEVLKAFIWAEKQKRV